LSQVLVIEDSPAIALLLRRRLEMAGHSVEVIANGLQALERLDPQALPDIVLVDFQMPGIDGIETMRRIRSDYPGLPVILVTAQNLAPEARREADAVVDKPIEFNELFGTISRLTAPEQS
jgi:two-component system response regulator GlrR